MTLPLEKLYIIRYSHRIAARGKIVLAIKKKIYPIIAVGDICITLPLEEFKQCPCAL
jgi:hypothetical protein